MTLNPTPDRRRFFRIDDTISLSYRLIDQASANQGLKSMGHLSGEYSLAATLDVLSQEAARIMLRLEKQSPELLELYKILDAKINAVSQAVMLVGSDVDKQACREVNLSAAGLAFQQAGPLEIGQYLAIEMYLPTTLALIQVYGQVIKCEAVESERYSIGVEYTHIREEDQELLIKHVVRQQWRQLREEKAKS
ncbi:PilZ domain-containing protein [Methylomonas sp. LL1]|uniref:PilZ domain-containing protein n=1 Tax=Methylomonas sp. LL1 TaxID=2785785 RepID=UPI0018C44BCE|nr:PilZ domain-containing protein [Methylomonas sp. LL1]QPK64748.1 PilZ domain-containing protein [Methylomonas sp. LL1]